MTAPERETISAAGRSLITGLLVAAMAMAVATPRRPAAAAGGSIEAAVKVAYLVKFGDFVEWPPSAFVAAESTLNLCLTGKVAFADSLRATVAGRRIAGRPVAVRYLAGATRASGCQILYVGGSDARLVAAALDAVRGANVLTVTDAVITRGTPSVISFVITDDHVRFAIDDRAASLNGLVISSKLLSLALSVISRNARAEP